MKYPRLNSWLLYKKKDDYTYLVKNCMNDQVHSFDIEDVRFFRELDGKTNPLDINPTWSKYEVKSLMRYLKANELIQSSRVSRSFLSLRISLFRIKFSKTGRIVALLFNYLLMISFLPVLLIGFSCYDKINLSDVGNLSIYIGVILGIVIGLILHEAGHALAGAGYGAHIFECGVMIGIPSGAYLVLEHKNVKNRLHRIQILAAGIEMNFLLTGIGFIFACLIPVLSGFFLGFAVNNFFLGIINLLLLNRFDGYQIMCELLGTQSLLFAAYDFITEKSTRKKLISQGKTGYVKIFSCLVGGLCQLAYPMFIIINIMVVLSWLV